jgi:hypothetical protein
MHGKVAKKHVNFTTRGHGSHVLHTHSHARMHTYAQTGIHTYIPVLNQLIDPCLELLGCLFGGIQPGAFERWVKEKLAILEAQHSHNQACEYVRVCMYVYLCVCMYVCMYVCMNKIIYLCY